MSFFDKISHNNNTYVRIGNHSWQLLVEFIEYQESFFMIVANKSGLIAEEYLPNKSWVAQKVKNRPDMVFYVLYNKNKFNYTTGVILGKSFCFVAKSREGAYDLAIRFFFRKMNIPYNKDTVRRGIERLNQWLSVYKSDGHASNYHCSKLDLSITTEHYLNLEVDRIRDGAKVVS